MQIKPTLFLRNEEGSSPGGGSPTPPPADPPALVADPAPTGIPSIADIRAALREESKSIQDGVFAALRKSGALKPDKPNEPAPVPSSPAQTASPSLADMERTIEIKFAVQQMRSEHGITEAQANYLKSHLDNSRPADAFAAAKSYLSDLGLVKAPAPATPISAPPAPPGSAKPPITPAQLGAPAPSDTRDPEAILHSRPQEATAQDFERLVAKLGHAKALDMWTAAQMAHARTIRVVPDYRRQR